MQSLALSWTALRYRVCST